MPQQTYFFTLRFPSEDQDHVFYATERQDVIEPLLELLPGCKLESGVPAPAPLRHQSHSMVGHGRPVDPATPGFQVVNAADVDLAQRVLYQQELELLEVMDSCADEPAIMADVGLPSDPQTICLWEYYKRASEWEPLISSELGQECPEQSGFAVASRSTKPKGRPVDTDPKEDEKLFNAWDMGNYYKYSDLARELGIGKKQVARAIDRHRQRVKRRQ